MTSWTSLSRLRGPLWGLLLGVLTFLVLFDLRQLDPTYLDWQLDGDGGQHYIGWEFFRYEPWTMPLGKTVGFGTPDGTSVVYTDSIPILALLFKAVRYVLPQPFQYIGLWVLACYALQGWFGWLLASLVTRRAYVKSLITVFFLTVPSMIYRHEQAHHALMGHWLILGALYLSLQSEGQFEARHPKLNWWMCWGAWVVLSGMVHLYLAAMVVGLYLASAPFNLRSSRLSAWRGAGAIAATMGAFFLALYLEGAFTVKSSNWATAGVNGFGRFSMNLLAAFSPGYYSNKQDVEHISVFLEPHHDYLYEQHEGLNYVGAGVLAIALIVAFGWLIALVRGSMERWVPQPKRTLRFSIPVATVLVLMAMFAASHRVAIGNHLLVHLPLGTGLLHLAEIFRASGRFFWPCHYAILLLVFRELLSVTPQRLRHLSAVVLHAALTVQVVDLSQFLHRYAKQNREVRHYTTPLTSPAWSRYMEAYSKVKFYPPTNDELYLPLGLLAAPRRVGVNVASRARFNPDTAKIAEAELRSQLSTGDLDVDTLYVFKDATLFNGLKEMGKESELLLDKLDGYYVAARSTPAAPNASNSGVTP